MIHLICLSKHKGVGVTWSVVLSLWVLLLGYSAGAAAQITDASGNAALSVHASHLLGFPNTKNNCNGSLSVEGDALRFERDPKRSAEVKIASVGGVFLSSESKQVGGTPMKVGKAAAPFGSGRVFSLFAHKKYDTLTVEYVDDDGGVHGAIFQLSQGQAERIRNEIVSRAAYRHFRNDQSTDADTAGASNENN